jgi:hypothetical protein
MRFSGAPCLAGVVVRVDERVFLGVGVVVTNGFSFSCVSLSTTRLLAGGDVSRVLQVRFPRSVAIATADLGLVSWQVLRWCWWFLLYLVLLVVLGSGTRVE